MASHLHKSRSGHRRNVAALVTAAVALLTMASCDDFLGILPLNEIVLENYWTNEDDVNQAVSACYSAMATNNFVKLAFVWGEFRSDNIVRGPATSNEEVEILEGNIQPDHSVTDWAPFYNVINLCNTVMHYAPDVIDRDPDFDETEWNALRAEVLTLRSLCYFYLVRAFRDVPLVLEPTIDNNTRFQQEAADPEEVMAQIISDLKEAERDAVKKYSKEEYNKGRVTRLAVQALLADVYLWQNDYDHCIEYCEKVIAQKVEDAEEENLRYDGSYPLLAYQLSGSVASGIHEAYNQIFGAGDSFESIFEIHFTKDKQTNTIIPGYFGNATNNLGAVTVASFIADGASGGNDLFRKTDLRAQENFDASAVSFYPIRKYVVESYNDLDKPTYQTLNLTNWIVYRLTDIMLLEAEALTEREGDADLRHAFDLVASVNGRANIEQMKQDTLAYDSYSTATLMRKLVQEERQRELMFEGKRWFDLVRMARRNGDNSAMLDLAKRKYSNPDAVKSKWIKPDMLYWPINESELKVNLKLKQNPAYDTDETIVAN